MVAEIDAKRKRLPHDITVLPPDAPVKLPSFRIHRSYKKYYYLIENADLTITKKDPNSDDTSRTFSARVAGRILGDSGEGLIIWKDKFLRRFPDLRAYNVYRTQVTTGVKSTGVEYQLVFRPKSGNNYNGRKIVYQVYQAGGTWCLDHIIENSPFLIALNRTFQKDERNIKLLSLAYFIVLHETADFAYYNNFVAQTRLPYSAPLDKLLVEDLISGITDEDRSQFATTLQMVQQNRMRHVRLNAIDVALPNHIAKKMVFEGYNLMVGNPNKDATLLRDSKELRLQDEKQLANYERRADCFDDRAFILVNEENGEIHTCLTYNSKQVSFDDILENLKNREEFLREEHARDLVFRNKMRKVNERLYKAISEENNTKAALQAGIDRDTIPKQAHTIFAEELGSFEGSRDSKRQAAYTKSILVPQNLMRVTPKNFPSWLIDSNIGAMDANTYQNMIESVRSIKVPQIRANVAVTANPFLMVPNERLSDITADNPNFAKFNDRNNEEKASSEADSSKAKSSKKDNSIHLAKKSPKLDVSDSDVTKENGSDSTKPKTKAKTKAKATSSSKSTTKDASPSKDANKVSTKGKAASTVKDEYYEDSDSSYESLSGLDDNFTGESLDTGDSLDIGSGFGVGSDLDVGSGFDVSSGLDIGLGYDDSISSLLDNAGSSLLEDDDKSLDALSEDLSEESLGSSKQAKVISDKKGKACSAKSSSTKAKSTKSLNPNEHDINGPQKLTTLSALDAVDADNFDLDLDEDFESDDAGNEPLSEAELGFDEALADSNVSQEADEDQKPQAALGSKDSDSDDAKEDLVSAQESGAADAAGASGVADVAVDDAAESENEDPSNLIGGLVKQGERSSIKPQDNKPRRSNQINLGDLDPFIRRDLEVKEFLSKQGYSKELIKSLLTNDDTLSRIVDMQNKDMERKEQIAYMQDEAYQKYGTLALYAAKNPDFKPDLTKKRALRFIDKIHDMKFDRDYLLRQKVLGVIHGDPSDEYYDLDGAGEYLSSGSPHESISISEYEKLTPGVVYSSVDYGNADPLYRRLIRLYRNNLDFRIELDNTSKLKRSIIRRVVDLFTNLENYDPDTNTMRLEFKHSLRFMDSDGSQVIRTGLNRRAKRELFDIYVSIELNLNVASALIESDNVPTANYDTETLSGPYGSNISLKGTSSGRIGEAYGPVYEGVDWSDDMGNSDDDYDYDLDDDEEDDYSDLKNIDEEAESFSTEKGSRDKSINRNPREMSHDIDDFDDEDEDLDDDEFDDEYQDSSDDEDDDYYFNNRDDYDDFYDEDDDDDDYSDLKDIGELAKATSPLNKNKDSNAKDAKSSAKADAKASSKATGNKPIHDADSFVEDDDESIGSHANADLDALNSELSLDEPTPKIRLIPDDAPSEYDGAASYDDCDADIETRDTDTSGKDGNYDSFTTKTPSKVSKKAKNRRSNLTKKVLAKIQELRRQSTELAYGLSKKDKDYIFKFLSQEEQDLLSHEHDGNLDVNSLSRIQLIRQKMILLLERRERERTNLRGFWRSTFAERPRLRKQISCNAELKDTFDIVLGYISQCYEGYKEELPDLKEEFAEANKGNIKAYEALKKGTKLGDYCFLGAPILKFANFENYLRAKELAELKESLKTMLLNADKTNTPLLKVTLCNKKITKVERDRSIDYCYMAQQMFELLAEDRFQRENTDFNPFERKLSANICRQDNYLKNKEFVLFVALGIRYMTYAKFANRNFLADAKEKCKMLHIRNFANYLGLLQGITATRKNDGYYYRRMSILDRSLLNFLDIPVPSMEVYSDQTNENRVRLRRDF